MRPRLWESAHLRLSFLSLKKLKNTRPPLFTRILIQGIVLETVQDHDFLRLKSSLEDPLSHCNRVYGIRVAADQEQGSVIARNVFHIVPDVGHHVGKDPGGSPVHS